MNLKPTFVNFKTGCSLITTAFLISFFCSVKAQQSVANTNQGIKMLARPYPDSVQLRWAPTSYELWQAGIKHGYQVERFTILSNNQLVKNPQATRMVFNLIKPWPLEKWEPYADIEYVGIAAEAVYGEHFTVSAGKNSSMYEIVNMATEQSNRFSFALFSADMSPVAAKAMGLWLTDKTVHKDESYLYKVIINNYNVQKVDTGYVLSGFPEFRILPRPIPLIANTQGKSVILGWDRTISEGFYTAFMIERSVGESDFSLITPDPVINPTVDEKTESPYFSYVDTLDSRSLNIRYRVQGISPFGERGPWSDTAVIKGGPVLSESPSIIRYDCKDNKNVTIGWDFPANNKALTGFKVMRSDDAQTGFKDISGLLTAQTRLFIDTAPMPSNYYKVFALGESGDMTMSLAAMVQPVDSFPPTPPTGLQAIVDSTGKVTIRWKANPEPDMFGYRVYRANNMNEEFSQLTVRPVRDTVFFDKINIKTLTKHVYYRLFAIDNRQNHSKFSEALEVKRPDFIAPVRPVFKEVKPNEKGIMLSWSSSSSNDIATQELYRYTTDTLNMHLIARFTDVSVKAFTDTTAVGDTIFRYRFYALDESGNRSVPAIVSSLSGRKINNTITLKAKAIRDKGTVELSWNAPVGKSIERYIIFRSENEAALSAFTYVLPPATTFADKQLTISSKYTYCIRAQFTDGTMGAISKKVEVEY